MAKKAELIVRIENQIYIVRGKRVVLDEDLARAYQVTTSALNQAVTRNVDKFPGDFMPRITAEDYSIVRSQIVISVAARQGRSI